MVGALDRQAQRRHVVDRLVVETIELLVAGTQFQHCLAPVPMRLGLRRRLGMHRALVRRVVALVAVGEFIQQATMPLAAGRQLHLEAQSAVGEHRARVARARPKRRPNGRNRRCDTSSAGSARGSDQSELMWPRRMSRLALTSNTSAKSDRIAISRLNRTGFWPWFVMSRSSCRPWSSTRDNPNARVWRGIGPSSVRKPGWSGKSGRRRNSPRRHSTNPRACRWRRPTRR